MTRKEYNNLKIGDYVRINGYGGGSDVGKTCRVIGFAGVEAVEIRGICGVEFLDQHSRIGPHERWINYRKLNIVR